MGGVTSHCLDLWGHGKFIRERPLLSGGVSFGFFYFSEGGGTAQSLLVAPPTCSRVYFFLHSMLHERLHTILILFSTNLYV